MPVTAHLFAGEGAPLNAAAPDLYNVGSGYNDDTSSEYDLFAKSVPVAPAGTGGECMFTVLYLTTVHYTADVSVHVTPVVDGVALDRKRIDLTGVANSKGERKTHEVGLYLAYTVASVEQLRYAPRGTWFQAIVETRYGAGDPAGSLARVVVESVELEYEVLRESKATDAAQ